MNINTKPRPNRTTIKINNLGHVDSAVVYNSKWWRVNRIAKLEEQPLCERCLQEGRTTPATEVHHIQPFAGMGQAWREYAYNYDNLMSLCTKCHDDIHNELNKNKSK